MGRSNRYRVRFASSVSKPRQTSVKANQAVSLGQDDTSNNTPARSRTACRDCRLRHIKCDEHFPVCTQCQLKGLPCRPRGRPPTQWRAESPWLQSSALQAMPAVNRRLLQYWVETACHMMTLDEDNNPLSFPIINQLMESEALIHALQSVSGAYEFFYEESRILNSIEERGKALQTIRKELHHSTTSVRVQSFLAVWLVGISSTWMDNDVHIFGQEHLVAARSILDILLQQEDFQADPFRPFVIGAFIWWDMVCSVLVRPQDQRPLNTPEICAAVTSLKGNFCTLISHAIDLFYYIACLGRYCRAYTEFGDKFKDVEHEDYLEHQLLTWADSAEAGPIRILNETYRLHGLLMLYRLCGRCVDQASEEYAHTCALNILNNMAEFSTDGPLFKFLANPLLTAGAELTSSDGELRAQVLDRCAMIYSTSRLPTQMWAAELLQELWRLRDAGEDLTWLQLMLRKRWTLMVG